MKEWIVIKYNVDSIFTKIFDNREDLLKYLRACLDKCNWDFNYIERNFIIFEGVEQNITYSLDLKEKENKE